MLTRTVRLLPIMKERAARKGGEPPSGTRKSGTNNVRERLNRWLDRAHGPRARRAAKADASSIRWRACGKQEHVMNSAFLVASAAALAGLAGFGVRTQDVTPAQDLSSQESGQEAGVFSQWLTADAPECVPVSQIGSVSRLTKLTPEQFQFVRALYIAIPPVSRELPPGDSAVVASADGKAMIALVAGGQACARFLAPDFVLSMLVQVGRGEIGMIGEPI
jgi:hypothetical protein